MRKLVLAMMAVTAAGAATIATSGPAAAYDYPWCLQGREHGIPGECAYQTYEQCQATASGTFDYCNINPRVAFRVQQPRRPRYAAPGYYSPGFGWYGYPGYDD
ncbi:DUF3551 domain-containing protein [Bradyrhizobium sp. NP1]|uniref:DUF3551 domain-containing protein n=1 Tax=Bradyrhizobium sp. NP1 TaxID=3049772 RepID=UPI0025A4FC34|nr:DUF3551 domain-containing protein [Bradyrhizobium sp. NP1]WJR78240.1 DUF3551 domain-containing protein [Bradyrhizobium sp. NP1]